MSRRTQTEWRELIAQQQSSGVSAAQFCRDRSINPKYFSTRKQQLCGSENSFVQVTPPVAPIRTDETVTLRVIEVEVPSDALLNSLSMLLDQRTK